MALTPRHSGQLAARRHHAPPFGFLRRIEPFFAIGEVTGGPLLVATLVALALVNSPWGTGFEQLWAAPVSLRYGEWQISRSAAEWINDALMPIFFLIIGTEVKREFAKGALSSFQTGAFPIAGALGGLIVPIGIFAAINRDTDTSHAWGVVAAMDTAFSLAIVAMFTTKLPTAVRAILLAFAAIDDIFGLLVIAGAYTATLNLWPLLFAGAAYLGIVALLKLRWTSSIAYILCGLVVWIGVFASGIHATIAGVALGFLLPTASRLSEEGYAERIQKPVDQLKHAERTASETRDEETIVEQKDAAQKHLGYIHEMTAATDEAAAQLVRVLTPWVSYVILPLFALSHVQIHFSAELLADSLASPLALGIVAGLALGKPLGFLSATWLATRLKLAKLPRGVTWRLVLGIGAVAGIGFTLSLFIAELALVSEKQIETASLAILAASVLSALFGYAILWSAADAERPG